MDRMNTALTDYVTTDQTLRQEKPEQFRRDFYRRPAIWAAAILLLLLIVINQFTGNLNARLGREKGFTEYVFIKMIEHQDEFAQEEIKKLVIVHSFAGNYLSAFLKIFPSAGQRVSLLIV